MMDTDIGMTTINLSIYSSIPFLLGMTLTRMHNNSTPMDSPSPKKFAFTLNAGSDVELACQVTGPAGPYKIAWIKLAKDNHLILLAFEKDVLTRNDDERLSVIRHNAQNTSTLLIRNLQPHDSAAYSCEIDTDPPIAQTGALNVTA